MPGPVSIDHSKSNPLSGVDRLNSSVCSSVTPISASVCCPGRSGIELVERRQQCLVGQSAQRLHGCECDRVQLEPVPYGDAESAARPCDPGELGGAAGDVLQSQEAEPGHDSVGATGRYVQFLHVHVCKAKVDPTGRPGTGMREHVPRGVGASQFHIRLTLEHRQTGFPGPQARSTSRERGASSGSRFTIARATGANESANPVNAVADPRS